MDQSSRDDTVVGVRPSGPSPGYAVSRQSSRDKHQKRSPGETPIERLRRGSLVMGEGKAISTRYLIVAVLVTGLVILAASAVQMLMIR